MRRLRIHSAAEQDISEAVLFYVERSLIAAERFLDEIEAALDLVRETPESWSPYRVGMRRYVMTSYPYSIIFRATEKEVHVYAVAHMKRRPLYWKRRRF